MTFEKGQTRAGLRMIGSTNPDESSVIVWKAFPDKDTAEDYAAICSLGIKAAGTCVDLGIDPVKALTEDFPKWLKERSKP